LNIDISKKQKHKILKQLSIAMAKEAHILNEYPHLLWQQLFNRLQWLDNPIKGILENEFLRRDTKETGQWLKLINPIYESEALIRTFKGHRNHINTCSFNPDHKHVISAGHGGELRVWDLSTGRETESIKGDFYHVYDCAFDPSGYHLTLCTAANTVVFDIMSRKIISKLEHPAQPLRAEFNPQGDSILTISKDHIARIWGIEGKLHCQEPVYAATYTINGDLLFVQTRLSTIILNRIETGESMILQGDQFNPLPWDDYYKPTWAFSNDRQFLAILEDSGQGIGIWDTTDGKQIGYINDQIHGLLACESTIFGPTIIFTTSDNGQLHLWAPHDNKSCIIKGHTKRIGAVKFNQNGQLFLSCSWDWTVKLWRIVECKQKHTTVAHTHTSLENIKWLAPIKDNAYSNNEYFFTPDGQAPIIVKEVEMSSGGLFGKSSVERFEVMNTATGNSIYTEGGHPTSPVSSVAINPDGNLMASAGMDGFFHVWNLVDGKRLATFSAMGRIEEVAFSSSGNLLYCCDEGKNIYYLKLINM